MFRSAEDFSGYPWRDFVGICSASGAEVEKHVSEGTAFLAVPPRKFLSEKSAKSQTDSKPS